MGFEEAHAVLAYLAGLAGRRPKPAAAGLAELATGAGSSGRVRRQCGGRVSRSRRRVLVIGGAF